MTKRKVGDSPQEIVTTGVLGAHGGAGATTLARALRLPELDPDSAAQADVVVLVGLGHAHGARSIIEASAGLGPDPVIVLGLTSTGWWTAPEARAMRRLLVDRLDAVVDLPWVWRWHDTAPRSATASRRWRSAALTLSAHVDQLSTQAQGAHR